MLTVYDQFTRLLSPFTITRRLNTYFIRPLGGTGSLADNSSWDICTPVKPYDGNFVPPTNHIHILSLHHRVKAVYGDKESTSPSTHCGQVL